MVTGIGLVKINGIIQLEIAQRTLLPYGQTRTDEVNVWRISQRQFKLTDSDVREGFDFHTLNYQNRSINLSVATAPHKKVITGVRFRPVNGVITLQVRVTDFNYIGGRLEHLEYTNWISSPNENAEEIILEKPGNPILTSNEIDVPNASGNKYIQFGPTDLYADASQLTVPFVDTMRVEPENPVVLSGIGLYHRGQKGSGGFIAPKVLVYGFEVVDPYSEH